MSREPKILDDILLEAGSALLDCQAFEFNLSHLLRLLVECGACSVDIELARLMVEGNEKKTAGQLIGMLKKFMHVESEIEDELREALKFRNHIVHRFFIEGTERFATISAREELKSDLIKMRTCVYLVANKIHDLAAHFSQQAGFDYDKGISEAREEVLRAKEEFRGS